MTCKEKKQKRIGPIKNHQGVLVFDDTEKTQAMNLYFSNVGESLQRKCQYTNGKLVKSAMLTLMRSYLKRPLCKESQVKMMESIQSTAVESVACILLDMHFENSNHNNQWAYKKGLSTDSLL